MDIDKMKCHEIISAIGDALSPEAQLEWNGMDDGGKNDFLIHAQREGFDAAVELVEETAKPVYHDETDNIFGRLNDDGNVRVLYETDGLPVTQLDENVYPVGAELSARYNHAKGIVLTREDAKKLRIEIEDMAKPKPETVRERFDADGSDGVCILLNGDDGQQRLWIEQHNRGLTVVDINTDVRELNFRDESDQNINQIIAEWKRDVEWKD